MDAFCINSDYADLEKRTILCVACYTSATAADILMARSTVANAFATPITETLTTLEQGLEDLLYDSTYYITAQEDYLEWPIECKEDIAGPPEFERPFYSIQRKIYPNKLWHAKNPPRQFVRRMICCNRKGIGFKHRRRR